jgi:O-antigen/teichoic acid export membrane protein
MTAEAGLTSRVTRGLAWSAVSTLTLRLGTFAIGIVLARTLTPEQFGVYAIALTVQAILMTLADLGLSADLIRSSEPNRLAPTVAALGLLTGAVLTAGMAISAPVVAASLGSPDAAPVIAVLSVTLLLGGAGVVPYAMLQRRFEQKKIFVISAVDFVLSTTVTLLLLEVGWGVMALALGRVVAQLVTLVLQFMLARVRPRVKVERQLVRPVLAYGLPVAAANLLSWALLNIDNVVVSKALGPVALGLYVLAFNVSSWPMTAIGQVVRSVALPAFSRSAPPSRDPALARGLALAWAAALPAGALVAVLSVPLVVSVYGEKWADSAQVLAALGLFGAMRVVFDLCAAYLLARGASGAVLGVQIVWFMVLVPATVGGALWFGVAGAGWAHLAVAVLVILPGYLWAARRVGADLHAVLAAMWPPVLSMIPAAAAASLVARTFDNPIVALLAGGLATGLIYLGLLHRWLYRQVRHAKDGTPERQSTSEFRVRAAFADHRTKENP